jgi:Tol biopolymer transport system component
MAMGLFCLSVSTSCTQPDESMLMYKVDGFESAYPRISMDGQRILYQSNQSGHWQLAILDLQSNKHTPVMTDAYNNNFPDWSYDNQWIAFTSDRDGNEEIYLMRTDGSNLVRVTDHPGRDIHPYFSPDGNYLLFNSTRSNGSFDIFRFTIRTGEKMALSQTDDNETCARYSTDMHHIIYLQNGTTRDDIILADSLNRHPKNISGTPSVRDGWPVFSHDDQWIYYSSLETGTYCIYRVKPDGTGKTRLTRAKANEEDARVSISRDGTLMIYNKRKGNTIEIRSLQLPSDG